MFINAPTWCYQWNSSSKRWKESVFTRCTWARTAPKVVTTSCVLLHFPSCATLFRNPPLWHVGSCFLEDGFASLYPVAAHTGSSFASLRTTETRPDWLWTFQILPYLVVLEATSKTPPVMIQRSDSYTILLKRKVTQGYHYCQSRGWSLLPITCSPLLW